MTPEERLQIVRSFFTGERLKALDALSLGAETIQELISSAYMLQHLSEVEYISEELFNEFLLFSGMMSKVLDGFVEVKEVMFGAQSH